jgi:hypothetical protein
MMLSPSAARLGKSIRLKGKSIPFRPYSFGSRKKDSRVGTILPKTTLRFVDRHVSDIVGTQRYKSTAIAAIEYDIDESHTSMNHNNKNTVLGLSYMGHSAAAEYRLKQQQQTNDTNGPPPPTATTATPTAVSESWMINVGRGNDNAWLMGPRNDQEWFTGMAPIDQCPGNVCILLYASEFI